MVRHIVMWKMSDEAKANDFDGKVQLLREKFDDMIGKIDGLLEIELRKNYKPGNFDVSLLCTFDSREAEEAYQTNPIHVAVKEIIGQWAVERACVDYDV